eukprot:NODE_1436_length_952_cov_868.037652_g1112_i0.p2 GENE.NODE_1436_length_952_cov_868.037652_g1112_i0~~NODE_1436_length_952_cov_868.037652_g1112_i0.p2  ORF type:complete len:272 (+),score=53.20 NODE_1436_length_952_cov_868.037652_g1112_i0:54-869(+)
MTRGPKKHLKRLNAPSHWMLDKLGGIYAPRPRTGPHKLADCMPLLLILRNKLKYALNYSEATMILKQRLVKVDGKIRTDPKYPAGFMDVVTIDNTTDKFRLLYDTKGRYTLHRIKDDEVGIKVCKVTKRKYGPKRRPYIVTNDGRTINYPDPRLKRGDAIVLDTETNKIKDWVRMKPGCLAMCTAGANRGRVGELVDRERHPGSFDIVHIKDAVDNKFATRLENCFVIGASIAKPLVSLPKGKGIRLSTVEDREKKLTMWAKQKAKARRKN